MNIETRYGAAILTTVNGLAALQCGMTETGFYTAPISTSIMPNARCMMKVFVRHADGSENEISGGYYVAEAYYPMGSGYQLISATWTPQKMNLQPGDALVFRVYGIIYVNIGQFVLTDPPEVNGQPATFITEPLGAMQLENVQWTVWYNADVESNAGVVSLYLADFWVENFAWTPVQTGGPIVWTHKVSWAGSAHGNVKHAQSLDFHVNGILIKQDLLSQKLQGQILRKIDEKFSFAGACSRRIQSEIIGIGSCLNKAAKTLDASGSCLKDACQNVWLQGRNYTMMTWRLLMDNENKAD